MSRALSAAVVVINYNYGHFLRAAVDSALAQRLAPTRVVVVDDGSTDDSRSIIAGYGGRIVPILKTNGGQDSAINAGFGVTREDVIVFLDADDLLEPTALEQAVARFRDDVKAVKVHWPLAVVDADGQPTGEVIPGLELPEGDLLDAVVRNGPNGYATSPTSGNAWAGRFLERVLPIPVGPLKSGTADAHFSMLAPLFGRIRRVPTPQGLYRTHGMNNYWGRTVERLPMALAAYDRQCEVLARSFAERGVPVDPEIWKRRSWLHRLERALADLRSVGAPGDTFVLVDQDQWGVDGELAGRRAVPFLERGGQYWGLPSDDETAICELERLRGAGARALALAWPAFWWLEYYTGFHRYVRAHYRCVLENDRLVVFDLCSGGIPMSGLQPERMVP